MGISVSSTGKVHRGLKKCLNHEHVESEYKQTNRPTRGPRITKEGTERFIFPVAESWVGALIFSQPPIPMKSVYNLKAIILSHWALFKIRMTRLLRTRYKKHLPAPSTFLSN